MREPPIVVFDLDHTLVHCDSFAGFTRDLILRQVWRVALTLLATPLLAPLALPRRTRQLALSGYVWIASVGLDEVALHAHMDEYVRRRFSSERLVCRPAVAALLAHRAAGARVLVATGCVAALAQRVCRSIGVAGVELVGSSLQPWRGGWIARRHCYGASKHRMLRDHVARERWDVVYTDSAADLPILRCGERRFLVNPRRADRARLAAALGSGFEVLEWPRG